MFIIFFVFNISLCGKIIPVSSRPISLLLDNRALSVCMRVRFQVETPVAKNSYLVVYSQSAVDHTPDCVINILSEDEDEWSMDGVITNCFYSDSKLFITLPYDVTQYFQYQIIFASTIAKNK